MFCSLCVHVENGAWRLFGYALSTAAFKTPCLLKYKMVIFHYSIWKACQDSTHNVSLNVVNWDKTTPELKLSMQLLAEVCTQHLVLSMTLP